MLALLAIIIAIARANFLVQLSNETSIQAFLETNPQLSSKIHQTYSFGSFSAFSGKFDVATLKYLYHNFYVAAISPDIPVSVDSLQVQENAPRHLARISQRTKLDSNSLNFTYDTEGQEMIDIYIIDTGIYAEHPQFEGRVKRGIDLTGEGPGDRNGHGTHVAGIAGSKTYGVAKKVNLIEVKALTGDGMGNLSTVVAGIDFAVNHRKQTGRKAVANLSLGAGYNTMLNNAVNAAVDSGLPMTVAAGNTNTAACATSPAGAKNAITVGAIDDRYDIIASFSNWGSCVMVFASGVYVTSLSHDPAQLHSDTIALSGTSMASPTVAGIMAMFMGQGASTEEAIVKINSLATRDAIDVRSMFFRPRTPNAILFNGLNGLIG